MQPRQPTPPIGFFNQTQSSSDAPEMKIERLIAWGKSLEKEIKIFEEQIAAKLATSETDIQSIPDHKGLDEDEFNEVLGIIRNHHRYELDLRDCPLSPAQVRALANSLENDESVKVLIIDGMNDNAGVIFAKMLEKNKGLKILSLTSNHFSTRTAEAFAESIPHNSTLHHLRLNNNYFNDQDGQLLIKSLACNNTLISLELYDNKLEKTTLDQIHRLLIKDSQLSKDYQRRQGGYYYESLDAKIHKLRSSITTNQQDIEKLKSGVPPQITAGY